MPDETLDARRNREEQYFQKLEQERLEKLRRKAAQEADTARLMESFGIREPGLVRDLADSGFDAKTFRLLQLVPAVYVAWSDGDICDREAAELQNFAARYGATPGTAAYAFLTKWLTERPSDSFFELALRAIKAMLRGRPTAEADALRREMLWSSSRVAAACGGFLGFGSRVSRDEESLMSRIERELKAA